jgi:hypothetical protein
MLSNTSIMLEEYFPHNKNYKKKYNLNSLSKIYNDINEGFIFMKKNKKNNFYKISIENNFQNPSDFNSIPSIIKENIENNLFNQLSFSFILFERKIKIYFILKETITKKIIKKYTNFVFLMTIWLHIISIHSSNECQQELNIYIYLSDNLKQLPLTSNMILDQENANTAFTRLCSEIIIYRNEEWFKVFIHETFHNFNMDFSNMNTDKCNKLIKNIFHVNSKVNLYESYTEFWARIMNISFISYLHTKNLNNFIKTFDELIGVEISYSTFQMIKVLNYMNIKYDDIITNFQQNYRENTNILSYFIVTNILLFNFVDFLSWCDNNNTNLYNFKKTSKNLLEFCKFIKNNYYNLNFLQNINEIEEFFENNKNKKNKNKKINYLIKNLRMTIYELK